MRATQPQRPAPSAPAFAVTAAARGMELRFSPDEEAFRDEVRAFLRERLPPDLAAKCATDCG